uniref:Uncharacterized protein n=1 Tax=Opuntia streptacantha TaxID=393608 RepID=A0A7C9CZB0_OPUST
MVPPPFSADTYLPIVTDFSCICVPSSKSLFGIPSKREGLIQPSVTSQPPRLTALILDGGFVAASLRLRFSLPAVIPTPLEAWHTGAKAQICMQQITRNNENGYKELILILVPPTFFILFPLITLEVI